MRQASIMPQCIRRFRVTTDSRRTSRRNCSRSWPTAGGGWVTPVRASSSNCSRQSRKWPTRIPSARAIWAFGFSPRAAWRTASSLNSRLYLVYGFRSMKHTPRASIALSGVSKASPNLIGRVFTTDGPNACWLSDITYIPTREGWLYLAAVLDVYSRAIVGWAMSRTLDCNLAKDALSMAIGRRGPPAVLHSDQGTTYAAAEYRELVSRYPIRQSMSRKGDCWDNAPMESFFHTLKTELVMHCDYKTRDQARASLFDYMEVFYNRQRRHSTLNYEAPLAFEAMQIA
jgi:transposase InsO family protein